MQTSLFCRKHSGVRGRVSLVLQSFIYWLARRLECSRVDPANSAGVFRLCKRAMAKALWTCTALAACLVILSGSVVEAIDRSRSRAAGSPKRKKGKVVGLNGTSHVFQRTPRAAFVYLYVLFRTHLHKRATRSVGHGKRESVKLKTAAVDFDFLRPAGDLRVSVAVFRQGSVNAGLAGARILHLTLHQSFYSLHRLTRPHTSITQVLPLFTLN